MSVAIESKRPKSTGQTKQSSPPDDWDAIGSGDVTDEVLLLRYRDAGDRRAFETLVQRYEREIYSYLRRYLSDAELAEDVFQAAFLQVHLKCRQFEEGRAFRPWLYAIATHAAIDAQRRNRRHRVASLDHSRGRPGDDEIQTLAHLLATTEPGPVARMEAEERKVWIRQAVDELPDTLRSTLVLVYYQGMKYTEVAEALDIPLGTVKSRIHTAVFKLNEVWREQITETETEL
jgi:RNA polymerase sigma-70 factor (ECF subfamily)